MSVTTDTPAHTEEAAGDQTLRQVVRGCAGDFAPASVLGQALLGGWPDVVDGPAMATREFVNLVEERGPAATGLVQSLLAAEPAPVTQLARMSRLTSLDRALSGRVEACDPGEYRSGLDETAPGADDESRLAEAKEQVAAGAAALAAGRSLAPAQSRILSSLARLESRCLLARSAGLSDRLEKAATATAGRRSLVARWCESALDLAHLADRLDGDDPLDPVAVRSRLAAVVGPDGMAALVAGTESWPGGQRLARVLKQLAQSELRVEDPAAAIDRLMAIVAAQGDRPLLAADPDPLLLGVFVLERGRGAWLALDLPGERLANARRRGFEPPTGVVVVGETLHVACTPADAELPQQPNRARAAATEEEKDDGAAARRQLVMTNMGTTSVLLEFLRDAKIISLPGLVEEVANRTRNPQVLETIATTRNLHTGFANRNVPLALLRSPVNVSVRTLRRFIHVKYVSKLELKRMAADKSGLRKEVHREIEKYLTTLA
ncbi:MAG: hypothetical protein GY838_05815 [bacterium]|nr:hypothetical protein [bacterium]